ncbi:MAG: hypothetical protein FWE68_04525 [Defluviitaleaceae bacterium]|nr:hypothetical protein [Defluviitaleaceae bacterium]
MTGQAFETLPSPVQELTFDSVTFDDGERAELGLIDGDGAYTNLGLLLSDQCRHVLKVSPHGEEPRIFGGSLVKQIEDAAAFLDRDDWKYIREMICAALIQRDYTFPGEMLLNIYPDRVSVIAMGKLAEGFTCWHNERLYTALRRMRYTVSKPDRFAATKGAFMIVRESEPPPEEKILEYIKKHGSINRKQAETVLGLRQTAAGKILRAMHECGTITAEGNGKNKKYILK